MTAIKKEVLGQEAGSSQFKRQKRDGGENIDRISALPDAILTRILSFLRTKEAVGTNVLSKRWKSAWTRVPTLEFEEAIDITSEHNDKKNSRYFKKFVDGVLRLHDCLFIKRFTLKCNPWFHGARINDWVSAATIRHVEELLITCQRSSDERIGPLPNCLYACERLKVLKIKGPFTLQVPALVCLNSLKVIWLEGIEMLDENSLMKLINRTPLLDELHLSSFSWGRAQTLYICSSTLKRLFVQDNLKCADDKNRRVLVDSPSLTSFGLFCHVVSLRPSPSVVSASIALHNSSSTIDVKLLESISNIVKLKIFGFSKNFFEGSDHVIQIPIFPNLKHLEIEVDDGAWQYVPYMLQNCPNLASLDVTMHTLHTEDDNPNPFFRLPSGLEVIMVRDFRGCDFEIEAIGFLLAKVPVLKKMTICLADQMSAMCRTGKSSPDLARLEKAFLKVLTFPRCSTACEIAFPSSTSKRSKFWH